MAAKKVAAKKAVVKKAASRTPAKASANDLAVEAGLTLSPNQIIQWEMRGGGAFVRAPSLKAFLKDIG